VQPRTTRTRAAVAATAAAAAASSKGGKAGASAGVSGKRKRKEVDLQQDAAAGQQQEQQVEPVLGPPPKLVLDQPGTPDGCRCRLRCTWHLTDGGQHGCQAAVRTCHFLPCQHPAACRCW
jgi:hypothetical protein